MSPGKCLLLKSDSGMRTDKMADFIHPRSLVCVGLQPWSPARSLKHYDHSPAASLLCPQLLPLNAKGRGKMFRVDTREGVLGIITAEEYLALMMRVE